MQLLSLRCDSHRQSPFHPSVSLIQHWIFAVFIRSMASSVLLVMYSIQSSSSLISAVSISSSVSFMKEMSLS